MKNIEENVKQKCIFSDKCIYCGTNYCQFADEVKALKKENEKLKEVTNTSIIEQEKLVAQVNKYSQCLKEIREIVDKNISFMDTASTTKAMSKIQDKISEVLKWQ